MKSNNVGNSKNSYNWIKPLKSPNTNIGELLQSRRKTGSAPSWNEGIVNTNTDHIKISYGDIGHGDDTKLVALVAPDRDNNFVVQWLMRPDPSDELVKAVLQEVRKELDFYLIELEKEDPWAYAQYHSRATSNIFSNVHWGWYPEGYKD